MRQVTLSSGWGAVVEHGESWDYPAFLLVWRDLRAADPTLEGWRGLGAFVSDNVVSEYNSTLFSEVIMPEAVLAALEASNEYTFVIWSDEPL